jgi:TRAP-type C4-dicarboxylate transport system permease large subunit
MWQRAAASARRCATLAARSEAVCRRSAILFPVFLLPGLRLDIDMMAFGMVFVVPTTIGNFRPPVGGRILEVRSILKCPIGEYTRASMPFLLAAAQLMALLVFVPAVVLFAPDVILGEDNR